MDRANKNCAETWLKEIAHRSKQTTPKSRNSYERRKRGRTGTAEGKKCETYITLHKLKNRRNKCETYKAAPQTKKTIGKREFNHAAAKNLKTLPTMLRGAPPILRRQKNGISKKRHDKSHSIRETCLPIALCPRMLCQMTLKHPYGGNIYEKRTWQTIENPNGCKKKTIHQI